MRKCNRLKWSKFIASEAGIPTLCTTVEEAELLSRLYKRGKEIVIYISVKSGTLGTTSSRNTIFEIRGSHFE